jgi:hypothetical protein
MPIPKAHSNANFTNKSGGHKRNFQKFKGKWKKNNGQKTNGQFEGKGISRKMIKMTTLKFFKGVDVRIIIQTNVIFPSTSWIYA